MVLSSRRVPALAEVTFTPTATRSGLGSLLGLGPRDDLRYMPPLASIAPWQEDVAEHRATLRRQLEEDAHLQWGGMSGYMRLESTTLPIDASPYQAGKLGSRENLVGVLHSAERLLVLGESGSGKTASLRRLSWELCGESEPLVPVLVPLRHYAGAPLAEWIRAILQQTGHLR